MLVTQVADHHSFEEKSRILKFPDSTAQGVSDNYQNIINSIFRIRDRTYFNAYLDWCMLCLQIPKAFVIYFQLMVIICVF